MLNILNFIDYEKSWNDPIVFYIQYSFIFFSLPLYIILQYCPANYGRHAPNRNNFMYSDKFCWFLHIIEVIMTIAHVFYYISTFEGCSMRNIIILSPFFIHYVNRGLIYPFLIDEKSKKFPLEMVFVVLSFVIPNSFVQCRSVLFNSTYSEDYLTSKQFLVGYSIFLIGFLTNTYSDYILTGLKRHHKGYVIPKGFLFDYVICPNYLGELLEWIGFFICTQTTGAFMFVLLSWSNLYPRAKNNYEWYINKFGSEFPKERKLIIPMLI